MEALPHSFYTRHDVLQISKDLLGKRLITTIDGIRSAGIIVETEAYRAPDDTACHAKNNLRTERTEIMFAEGGKAYVYICYGIHHLFNVVTAEEDMAHAVLIRAVEPVENVEIMLQRRGLDRIKPQLTAGPGVMSKALGISPAQNKVDLTSTDSPIWLADTGIHYSPEEIASGIRVGVGNSGVSADWPWRFWVKGSPWVSKWKR